MKRKPSPRVIVLWQDVLAAARAAAKARSHWADAILLGLVNQLPRDALPYFHPRDQRKIKKAKYRERRRSNRGALKAFTRRFQRAFSRKDAAACWVEIERRRKAVAADDYHALICAISILPAAQEEWTAFRSNRHAHV